jgi:hypothetical protein
MPIVHTKQDWSINAIVRVGFLQLRVVACRAEYDGLPDIYELVDIKTGTKRYEFIPHNGLTRVN